MNDILVYEFDDGEIEVETKEHRIFRAAFTRNEKHHDQLIIFPGYVCQGAFSAEDKSILDDYGWEEMVKLHDGKAMWRHLNEESAIFTASALDLPLQVPKRSLVFTIKENSIFW